MSGRLEKQKRQIKAFAAEISANRPTPDVSLEQFLMEDEGMVEQLLLLANRIEPLTDVVFIGDDDHISLLLAKFLSINISVFDIDERVVRSINELAGKHELEGFVRASLYDVRDDFPEPGKFSFFYINPPYSSKNEALGVKVWLMRALDAIKADCDGVLVFPGVSSDSELAWVATNVLEFSRYLVEAGCVISAIEQDKHTYIDTNDKHLYSTNYVIHRIGQQQAPRITVPFDERLYR
jgi:predicted methyltransferase